MSAQRRVMFVDDEAGVRASWGRYLTEHGFAVTTAETGERAIELLDAEPVDVVVSDLRMPGVDGIGLLEWLHEEHPETRFILLTGYGSEESEQKARELGAFEYLNKPIRPDTLAAVVTAAMHLKLAMVMEPTEPESAVEPATPIQGTEAATPEETRTAVKTPGRRALEIGGGLIVAPMLGLAFVMFLPVIGFGALFWMVGERLWGALRPATT